MHNTIRSWIGSDCFVRFSLLSLIAIITLSAFVINLYSSYDELRKTREELAFTIGQLESLGNGTYREAIVREYEPHVAKQRTAYESRANLAQQAENIFESLVAEQSRIVSREGMVSIREIPTISSSLDFSRSVAVYVPESRPCEVELEYLDEHQFFQGFQKTETYRLKVGLNTVAFTARADGAEPELVLAINDQVVAKAVGHGVKLVGYSLNTTQLNPQRDLDSDQISDLLPLLDYEPSLETSGAEIASGAASADVDHAEIQPQIYLRLRELKSK